MVIGPEERYHCHFMMIKALHSMNVTSVCCKKNDSLFLAVIAVRLSKNQNLFANDELISNYFLLPGD
jgi:hypothetical protein